MENGLRAPVSKQAPKAKKSGNWFNRKAKNLVVALSAAAIMSSGFAGCGYNKERNHAPLHPNVQKTEQRSNAITPPIDSLNTQCAGGAASADTIFFTGGVDALGFPKLQKAIINVQDAEKSKIKERAPTASPVKLRAKSPKAKQKASKGQNSKHPFTIENGLYKFDLKNAQNARLAYQYGISGFVKEAMKDAGIYKGINKDFLKIVDENCRINFAKGLEDCNIWNRRDLSDGHTVYISLKGSGGISGRKAEKKKPQRVQESQNRARLEKAAPQGQISQQINCDSLLCEIGLEPSADGFFKEINLNGEDGHYYLYYTDIPRSFQQRAIDDTSLIRHLSKGCDIRIIYDLGEPPSVGTPPSKAPAPRQQDTDSSMRIRRLHSPFRVRRIFPVNSTGINRKRDITDSAKQAATQYLKNTEEKKDKSSNILKRSTRINR